MGTSAEFGEDAVKLDKNGMRSLFGKFKEYKENYEYVFGHQSEIAAMYYQNSRDQLLNNFKGTLKALRDAVAAFDSNSSIIRSRRTPPRTTAIASGRCT